MISSGRLSDKKRGDKMVDDKVLFDDDYIKTTEWFRPCDQDAMVSQSLVFCNFVTKKGRELEVGFVSAALISGQEEVEVGDKIDELKAQKERESLLALKLLLIELVNGKRTGFKFHRGYFSAQRIEPLKRDQ